MARWTVCMHAGCPELAPVKVGRCEAHQRPPWQNPSQHTQQRPSNWESRRQAILRRDHFRCQMVFAGRKCGRKGGHVDHIVPVADGGSWEPDNLWTLCVGHHADKTRLEAQRRNEVLHA